MKGLIIFDCDGVLTNHYSSWALLHEYFGSRDNKYFAELYRRGLITYLDWMKIDIALMIHSYGKPITRKEVVDALSKISIDEEAYSVVNDLKRKGFIVGVISSGIDLLVERVCRELGINLCYYNELLFVDDELIPGGKPNVPLKEKPRIIRDVAEKYGFSMDRVAYIGDSVWDIPVFREVGLPIAKHPCGEACGEAKYVVRKLGEIPGIIYRYFEELERKTC
jgi:phosphoserine phosphatase